MPVLRWASGDGLFLSFFSPIYFFRLSRRKLRHGQAPSLGFGLAVEACAESGATFMERMTAKERARKLNLRVGCAAERYSGRRAHLCGTGRGGVWRGRA